MNGDLEKTELKNAEQRRLMSQFRARMARLLAEDPEDCECDVCVRNWEELG
jgi:hypothetical protein